MPTVKMTEIIEVVDRNITDLKAGDPSWTPEQKRKAKDAIQMMQAFKVLTAESCGDTVQGMPTWPGHPRDRCRQEVGTSPGFALV